MPTMRRLGAALSAAFMLSACGSAGGDERELGSITVTVTLSRTGPPGPSLDHSPIPGISVTAISTSQRSWSASTNSEGEAVLSIPPGEYDVDIGYCPDAPQHVEVTAGARASTRFDCLAP
ncbi:hypothetical protein [Nocardioides sp. LS1]|uniref:hypothetical protein n=1 Tax=Nocardioides sp. LS1 TaxID=1027620 RepID=UPI000F621396|nr:hypothetical protein [Nocardioides sp. LS1]GCD89232.1 hypothetical protein NLS1_12380 [Nocardioides sp. LS1]